MVYGCWTRGATPFSKPIAVKTAAVLRCLSSSFCSIALCRWKSFHMRSKWRSCCFLDLSAACSCWRSALAAFFSAATVARAAACARFRAGTCSICLASVASNLRFAPWGRERGRCASSFRRPSLLQVSVPKKAHRNMHRNRRMRFPFRSSTGCPHDKSSSSVDTRARDPPNAKMRAPRHLFALSTLPVTDQAIFSCSNPITYSGGGDMLYF